MTKKNSVYVIGAGPAGLAAARELANKNHLDLFVLEKDDRVGGISRTESHNGYLFDIGGHRFFTKNERIDAIWRKTLGPDLLTVQRKSKIYYNRRYFHYPLRFWNTVVNLGGFESVMVLVSYVKARMFPSPEESSFEGWTVNRFGKRLYRLFFKSYTEKVWGIPCSQIQSDWAAQRIKGLSLVSTAIHAIFKTNKAKSLIDEFSYPMLGPGMMWERFREHISAEGGAIELDCPVVKLHHLRGEVTEITYWQGKEQIRAACDHVISSIPLDNLIATLEPAPPSHIIETAKSISYRAFIIVVLIIDRKNLFPDQWLYIHAPEVLVGRIQNFKNWSACMVPHDHTTSLGMEYFCNEDDELWNTSDQELIRIAGKEIELLGIAKETEVIDGVVLRQPKAYPIYDQHYKEHLEKLKRYLDQFKNLQTVGRNGMHRYNNMDHSMLTGIMAAENILGANHKIWETVDADEYLEENHGKNTLRMDPDFLAFFSQRKLVMSTVAIILLSFCFW